MMDTGPGSLRVACADLNGVMRGRRLPGDAMERVEFTGLRLPLSTLALDIFGQPDRAAAAADPDGQLRVTERGAVPMPWLSQSAALLPMWMFTESGRPEATDPRHALAGTLTRWARHGWTAKVRPVLEVYLVDDTGPVLTPAVSQVTRRVPRAQAGGLTRLEDYEPFLDALESGARVMGIGIDSIEAAAGPGQIRISVTPAPALKAADDIWLLKALLRGTARAHDMAACLLARPFAEAPGSALRLGYWPECRDKRNAFDNGLQAGSDVMHQAVAGGVSCLPGAMLVLAPHEQSYTRFGAESQAPTGASWGYENRSCALRIPGGDPAARRIEHRTPGADANPYLALAAILGGAIAGVEDDLTPPAPVIGDAWEQRVLDCPMDWDTAIERFGVSPRMARIFAPDLITTLTGLKRQEQRRMARLNAAETQQALLDAV